MSVLEVEKSRGLILVYYGPMGSRKSGAIVDIAKGLEFNRKVRVLAASSHVNVNDGPFILARDGGDERKYPAIRLPAVDGTNLTSSNALWAVLRQREFEIGHRVDVLIVDEGNHFDLGLPYVLRRAADGGRVVLVSGLDKTFRGDDFGSMGTIIRLADQKFPKIAYCQIIKPNGEQCDNTAGLSARVRRITDENKLQPVSYFTFKGEKCEGKFGFDYFFSPTNVSRDNSRDVDYFAACDECHGVTLAQETTGVQEYIRRHPGIAKETLLKQFEGMPHLDDIVAFLLNPEEHRTEVIDGRIRSYN